MAIILFPNVSFTLEGMCALRCSFYCDINGVSYSIIKHTSEFHATLEEFRVKIDILSQQFDYIKLITYHLELTVSIFFASKINGK